MVGTMMVAVDVLLMP